MLSSSQTLASIAFPAISTGIFGYPRAEAAAVASQAIEEFLSGDRTVKEVRLIFFQRSDMEVFVANHSFTDTPM